MKDMPSPLPLRPPWEVMRLSRLGSLHQTRLSFMRVLTRRMAAERWRFEPRVWAVDDACVGHAVYTVHTGARAYSLVAFAHDLPAEKRSDRVIAEAWDATFALFDGVPDAEDISRLSRNVPVQEAGRISARELTLSRANRSVRLWDHVVDRLSRGQQPDAAMLEDVGYLMRTTAVYGSGKFGAADRDTYAMRPEVSAPFQAEMLTVYLIRTFVRDLVEHAAACQGGAAAVPLDPEVAARLGIGNSTGLGMAPFLVTHPALLNAWITTRETAIARVCGVDVASGAEVALFVEVLDRAVEDLGRWRTTHPAQARRVAVLRRDMTWLRHQVRHGDLLAGRSPWRGLCDLASCLSEEAQELLLSLMLEPYAHLVDDLAEGLSCDEGARDFWDPAMPVGVLRGQLREVYGDLLERDWTAPEACARAWYVSEEKLEPRLGERHAEPIAEYEQPLAPARDAAGLMAALAGVAEATPVAEVLAERPDLRGAVTRAQLTAGAPYAEIRDNTIAADLMPIDMLRCKLSFFGATRFDPRSDRWVRICMFAGAPYPEDLQAGDADRWVYPVGSRV